MTLRSFLCAWGQTAGRAAILAALLVACSPRPAAAVNLHVGFDGGPTIFDGGAGDLDGLVNDQITFNGNYGQGGYAVSGTLYQTPPNPVGVSLSGYVPPITGSLTLTNFVAEALSTSNLLLPLTVRFEGDFVGTFSSGTALDVLTAEVGNSLSLPVPAGTDTINVFQSGIFDAFTSTTVAPPYGGVIPLGNPNHPGPGTTPYTVTGNGPVAVPALTNPTITSFFQVSFGQVGDQFILPSSAEVGFTSVPVPEPSSIALLGMGLLGVAAVARRRSRATLPR